MQRPIIGWVAWSAYKQHQNKDWDSGPPVELQRAIDLSRVRELDPDFSPIVFEDFAYRLFATAHRARSWPDELAALAPYIAQAARTSLANRRPQGAAVQQVIVGGPLCESGDIFTQEEGGFVSQRGLPAAAVGDFLVIQVAGAYGFAMASNYNSKPLAAEVLIRQGRPYLIRARQTFADLIAGEVIP